MNKQLLIGQRIKKSREDAGLTQEQLGSKTGYSAMGISLFEKGKRNIKISDVENFASALNVTSSYLLEPMIDSGFANNQSFNSMNRYRIDYELDEDVRKKISEAQNSFEKFLDESKE